MLSISKYS